MVLRSAAASTFSFCVELEKENKAPKPSSNDIHKDAKAFLLFIL